MFLNQLDITYFEDLFTPKQDENSKTTVILAFLQNNIKVPLVSVLIDYVKQNIIAKEWFINDYYKTQ